MDAESPAQGVINDLPSGCFTRRACYCNDFVASPPAIFSCHLTERSDCILDFKQAFAGKVFSIDIFADDGTDSAFCEGVADVIVPVEILAGNSKKAVARFSGPRVRAYACSNTANIFCRLGFYNSSQISN